MFYLTKMDDSENWASQIINEILEECAAEKMVSEEFGESLPIDTFEETTKSSNSLSKNFCVKDTQKEDSNVGDVTLEKKYQVGKPFLGGKSTVNDLNSSMTNDINATHSKPFTFKQDILISKEIDDSLDMQIDNPNKNIKDDSFQTSNIVLASFCRKEIEEGKSYNENILETFYDCDSRSLLNSEFGAGNDKGVYEVKSKNEMRIKNCKSIFSCDVENDTNNDFRVKDTIYPVDNSLNEILNPSNEFLKVIDIKERESNILKKTYGTLTYDNLLDNSGEENLRVRNSVIVEIYRKIVNFFEICIISPVASIFENYLEILEFILALVTCTIYMYYTNIKSKLENPRTKKKLRSNNAAIAANRNFPIEEALKPLNINIKTSNSVESLITFSSDSNSNEDGCDIIDGDQNVNLYFNKNIINMNFASISNELKEDMPSQLKKGHKFIESPVIGNDLTDFKLKADETTSPNFPLSFNEYSKEIAVLDLNRKPGHRVFEVDSEISKLDIKGGGNVRTGTKVEAHGEVKEKLRERNCFVLPIIGMGTFDSNETESETKSQISKPNLSEICDINLSEKPFQMSLQILGNESKKIEFEKGKEYPGNCKVYDIFSGKNETALGTSEKENNLLESPIIDIGVTDYVSYADQNQSKTSPMSTNDNLKGTSFLDLKTVQNATENILIEDNNFHFVCKTIRASVVGCIENDIDVIDIAPQTVSEKCEGKQCTIQTPSFITRQRISTDDITYTDLNFYSETQTKCRTENQKHIEKNNDEFTSQQREENNEFSVEREASIVKQFIKELTLEEVSDGCLEESTTAISDCEYNEYQKSVMRYTQIVEFDETDENNMTSSQTDLNHSNNVQSIIIEEITLTTEEISDEEVDSSYEEHLCEPHALDDAEDREILNTQDWLNKMSGNVDKDCMDISLEVKASFQSQQSLEVSEETDRKDSLDGKVGIQQHDVRSTRKNNCNHINQKAASFSTGFKLNAEELSFRGMYHELASGALSRYHPGSAMLPNTNYIDNSNFRISEQRLIHPPLNASCHADAKLVATGCFHDLPGILSPISRPACLKENSDEDCQYVPSFNSEPFEVEIFSNSKNAIADFISEVNEDRRKHKKRRNSLKSKVSSVFNRVKNFHDRFVNTATDVGSNSYKKHTNEHSF